MDFFSGISTEIISKHVLYSTCLLEVAFTTCGSSNITQKLTGKHRENAACVRWTNGLIRYKVASCVPTDWGSVVIVAALVFYMQKTSGSIPSIFR